ncbi:Golgi complex component 7-domain-containing protein [Zopfochytrium polystomum]|nr:Golgi complex component 7-domain-containing protein [Zopfochytrium polystomum]
MPHEAFDALLRLDTIRSRMVAARAALQEADSWNTLTSELDAIFATQDVERASGRLAEAAKSLVVLQDTAEFEERKAVLIRLQNQLEALLGPKVIAALNGYDIEESRKCYGMFEQMQRREAFASYYYKTRKAPLVSSWSTSFSGLSDFTRLDLAQKLSLFYNDVLQMIQREAEWCPKLFPNHPQVLAVLTQQTLSSLKPTFSSLFSAVENSVGIDYLPLIVKAYSATLAFGHQVENIIQSTYSESAAPERSRRSSASHPPHRKPSFSGQIDLTQWGQAPFDAFLLHQLAYSANEVRFVTKQVSQMLPADWSAAVSSMDEISDTTKSLLDVIPRAVLTIENAFKRGIVFTQGFSSTSTKEVLNSAVLSIISRVDALISLVRDKLNIDSKGISKSGRGGMRFNDEDDFLDRGVAEEDEWILVQIGLRLLLFCSTLYRKLRQLDSGCVQTLKRLRSTVLQEDDAGNLLEAEPSRKMPAQKRLSQQIAPLSLPTTGSQVDLSPPPSEEWQHCASALFTLQTSKLNDMQLRRFLTSLDAPAGGSGAAAEERTTRSVLASKAVRLVLFSPSMDQLTSLSLRAQRLIFDLLFQPLGAQIAQVTNLDVWGLTRDPSSSGSGSSDLGPIAEGSGAYDLRFSLSPLSYITRVGETLLTLPQQLEVHSNEVLGFGVMGLPYLKASDFGGDRDDWPDDDAMGGGGGAEERGDEGLLVGAEGNLQDGEGGGGGGGGATDAGEDVTHLWITAIARATVASYQEVIYAIPKLGAHGARQLAADIDYFLKVLEAMDVEAIPELEATAQLLDMTDEELAATLDRVAAAAAAPGAGDGPAGDGPAGEGGDGGRQFEKHEGLVRKIALLRNLTGTK